jgi:hypothetical protein
VLQTGAGLPLLFPKFEVGFGYSPCSGTAVGNEWRRQDTAVMDAPSIRVGHLLPHAPVKVVSGANDDFPNLQYLSATDDVISTTDLPAQLARDDLPIFVAICVGAVGNMTVVK